MVRACGRSAVVVFVLLGLAPLSPVRAEDAPLKGIDDYIAKAMKDWEVPGLAIAVVKDDTLVFVKGYGVRKLGESAEVDKDTLFAVGSTSKAFTAACLAMLVDEGKIKWDDPVIKHMPSFQLYDPYATHEITIRDLLCHRSGLNRHEAIWYGSPANRDEVLRRLRHVKPDWSFRSKYGYQNIMFLAAGQIIPAVTGKSWDDFVKERIFKPLGMANTNTSVNALPKGGDVASPHHRVKDKLQPVPWRNIDNIGPAGSINSSAADMAQWVRLQLNEGARPKEKDRLLSSGAIKTMHSPQTAIPIEGVMAKMNPDSHLMAYGLGWMIQDYRGKKLVQHAGGIDGMNAQVGLLPEEKLGVVVLANSDESMLPLALMYRIIDAYLRAPAGRDWSAELLKTHQGLMDLKKKEEKKQEDEHVKGTKPSLAPEKYAGTYKSEIYGEVKVVREKDKLVVHFGPSFVGDLEHWHYDTFQATWRDPTMDKSLVTFVLDSKGKVAEIKSKLTENSEMTFKRTVDTATAPTIQLTEKDLQKFVGTYELKQPPLDVSVEIVGGKLKAVVSGQSLTLVPIKPTRFRIEGAPENAVVQFDVQDGKVKGMTFEQGKGPALTLERKK